MAGLRSYCKLKPRQYIYVIVNKVFNLVAAAYPAVYSMDQRPLLSRPQSAQDWEDRKAAIVELYESKTLKETMTIMENKHSFKATYVTTTLSIPYINIVQ